MAKAPRKGQKASASTARKAASKTTASRKSGKPAKKPWLSIYSGGMPWFGRPATEPLKTMDEIARMGVRDFYMDQCCDGVIVTEVTEDTVTAVCDYGS